MPSTIAEFDDGFGFKMERSKPKMTRNKNRKNKQSKNKNNRREKLSSRIIFMDKNSRYYPFTVPQESYFTSSRRNTSIFALRKFLIDNNLY